MRKLCLFLATLILVSIFTGCGAQKEEIGVQSVSDICGLGSTAILDQFAGMVTAQGETNVEKTAGSTVSNVAVKVGDTINKGDPLFTYDTVQTKLDLEKAKLEVERYTSLLKSYQETKESLINERNMVAVDEQLSYTVAIKEADINIQDTNYNIKLKQQEIAKLENMVSNTTVSAPVSGRIQAINEDGATDDNGRALPYMTIVETAAYRVKGYVNENNAASVSNGMNVVIVARVGDGIWRGTITEIDWDNPIQNTNYYSSDTQTSSKYPFYVTLEKSDGLLLGQHVYIRPDNGSLSSDADAIALPSYYIIDVENPSVWAKGNNGKLEKRNITIGDYNPETDTYQVLGGLDKDDMIAFPDTYVKAGMVCVPYEEWTPPEVNYEEYISDEYNEEYTDEFGMMDGEDIVTFDAMNELPETTTEANAE